MFDSFSVIVIETKRREEQPADALYSEHLLQMLYTMGILRLTMSFGWFSGSIELYC